MKTRHTHLAESVKNPSNERNLFCCCFVFKLSNGQEKEIPLKGKFVPKDERLFPLKVIQLLTNFVGISDESNVILASCNPFYQLETTINQLYKTFFNKIESSQAQTSPADKNQGMILKALGSRLDGNSSRAMRLTDSETKAIYVLQHKYVIDNIIDELCKQINSLQGTPQITSIEFHGCTTRDMCPLCFTNMNIIQYLCNDPAPYDSKQFSFLKYLKHILTAPITEAFNNKHTNAIKAKRYANPNCPTKMFI